MALARRSPYAPEQKKGALQMSRAIVCRRAKYGAFCSLGLLFLTGLVAGAGADSPTAGITAPGRAGVELAAPVAWADVGLPAAQPPGDVPEVPRDGDPPGKDPYAMICCEDVVSCYVCQGPTCPFGMTEVDCPCPAQ